MRYLSTLLVLSVVFGLCLCSPMPARADDESRVVKPTPGKCKVRACKTAAKRVDTSISTTKRSLTFSADGRSTTSVTMTFAAPPPPEFDEFTDAYLPLQRAGGVCGMAGFGGTDDCRLRLSTDPEPPEPDPDDPDTETVTYITISPYQAALMAAAYLPLEPGQPKVGPPPTLNKWKTAAVGYPLWIWAEGNLDPAPVSESVSGLSVSLDASLARIVYAMGDGTTITCGPGTPWRRGAVPAGTPSPDCGHTYTEPSLPKGDYTITATTHWSVAWTAGGQSGTIPFTQTSSTTLPVGEIHTLVR